MKACPATKVLHEMRRRNLDRRRLGNEVLRALRAGHRAGINASQLPHLRCLRDNACPWYWSMAFCEYRFARQIADLTLPAIRSRFPFASIPASATGT